MLCFYIGFQVIKFYRFPSTTTTFLLFSSSNTTTTTFLLFSLHHNHNISIVFPHHHHHHISIAFPPPPPPPPPPPQHFYCFHPPQPSPPPPSPPHFYCFPPPPPSPPPPQPPYFHCFAPPPLPPHFYYFLFTTTSTFLLFSSSNNTTTTATTFLLFSILLLLVSFFSPLDSIKDCQLPSLVRLVSMSCVVNNNRGFLQLLADCPVHQSQFLLKTAIPQQLHSLVQVLYNILRGHISIPEENKRVLQSYKDALPDLARPNVPYKTNKRVFVQGGSGFIKDLLAPVVSSLGFLML